ncbi:helix-turn-helix domain-containing protein [Fructilactobacillus ixorae]|uniref:Helix-turn-helix domain-containing protein n=1 Tax=Fructilactobacillus ixorae TaxID=1750535 RepID=A0ABY5C6P8_9LACO|nr:helix-turn-helix transcriptional regulator [Fructilactobacillus ixorae]USS93734.1 helix-turn-helix domain-containing protein [Fructilactobacillus ixorae]
MLVFPTDKLLVELSQLIRTRRQQLHLSQAELARGICTQTTISTLENGTHFSKWELVPKLLERLHIEPQELEHAMRSQAADGERQLQQIETALFQFDFHQATAQLNAIRRENLDTKAQLSRYYCYQGLLKVVVDSELDDAIVAFDLALSRNPPRQHSLTWGWVYLGEALTYQRMHLTKRAQRSLQKAFGELQALTQVVTLPLTTVVKFGLAVVTLGLLLRLDAETQAGCQRLRHRLQAHYSYYCLADLYYLEGLSLQATGQAQAANRLLTRADQLVHLKNSSKFERLMQIYQQKRPELE